MLNYINKRLQQILGSNQVFGNVSVIAVGDLFQLKPVFDSWIFKNTSTNYNSLATNLWKEHFLAYELTEIMRQKEDKSFAAILNRLREGKHTKNDITSLQSRLINQHIHPPTSATRMYHTNAKVIAHNNLIFSQLQHTKAKILAQDIVTGDVENSIKSKILNHIPDNPQKTMGLLKELCVGINQRIDLCINISVEDGLTNGASGVVTHLDRTELHEINTIWVKFDDCLIGKSLKTNNKHLYRPPILPTWTPITRIARQFRTSRYKNADVMRKQFPLRPASAKTIHRCQGDHLAKCCY